ncbi:MAG: threonine/serine exporter family protein [Pseudoxanthomonas suwonensis]|nr:threonine/serine exporter family protein [Pseudoxanthomonas suwonensis]
MPQPVKAGPEPGYAQRIAFVLELVRRLHLYGTTAQRLEAIIVLVSQRMGLECQPWVSPTGIVMNFNDPTMPPGESEITRVIRVPLGEVDLRRLVEADRIAEDVTCGRMGIADGHAALQQLDEEPRLPSRALHVLACALASGSVAGLLRLPWLEIATGALVGLVIGLFEELRRGRPRLAEASDAIAGIVAGTLAVLVASFIAPINLNTVIIASLIVLLPGMALTNAVNELTSQHLISGSARFAGAVTTVMKLTVGTAIALAVATHLGLEPQVRAWRPQPEWLEWAALISAGVAFAVLFRAQWRDAPVVIAAAMAGYLISRWGGLAWGGVAGVFIAALVVTAAGNAYARWVNRPGAVVRVPGIILLVPGSTSLRGLMTLVQQQDAAIGQQAVLAVLNVLLALLAGLLFGNLLLPTRRNL